MSGFDQDVTMSNEEVPSTSGTSTRRSRRIAGLTPSGSEQSEEIPCPTINDALPLLYLNPQNIPENIPANNGEQNQDAWVSSFLNGSTSDESQASPSPSSSLSGHADVSGGLTAIASSSYHTTDGPHSSRRRDCRRCHVSHPQQHSQLGSLRSSFAESSSSEHFHVRGESFCTCTQLTQRRELQCSCGEEDNVFEWVWDMNSKSSACSLTDDQRGVQFHMNYSSGTAAVRGNLPMTEWQHFWEIKMTTPVYGTDMMVGVGTESADLDAHRYNFCSLLGRDAESWGLSYYGRLHHKGTITQLQGSRFGQGSIIGVHLDMWRGILSFYKNRRPLGVGYTGLSGKVLFPMVSSTAARTGMRLIKACSFQTSLQFLCCQVLREIIPSHLDVINELKLPPGLQAFLTNNLSWLLRPNELSKGTPPVHRPGNRKRLWSRRFPVDTTSSSDEEDTVHSVRGSSRYKRRRKEGYTSTLHEDDHECELSSSDDSLSEGTACFESKPQPSRS